MAKNGTAEVPSKGYVLIYRKDCQPVVDLHKIKLAHHDNARKRHPIRIEVLMDSGTDNV